MRWLPVGVKPRNLGLGLKVMPKFIMIRGVQLPVHDTLHGEMLILLGFHISPGFGNLTCQRNPQTEKDMNKRALGNPIPSQFSLF